MSLSILNKIGLSQSIFYFLKCYSISDKNNVVVKKFI